MTTLTKYTKKHISLFENISEQIGIVKSAIVAAAEDEEVGSFTKAQLNEIHEELFVLQRRINVSIKNEQDRLLSAGGQ